MLKYFKLFVFIFIVVFFLIGAFALEDATKNPKSQTSSSSSLGLDYKKKEATFTQSQTIINPSDDGKPLTTTSFRVTNDNDYLVVMRHRESEGESNTKLQNPNNQKEFWLTQTTGQTTYEKFKEEYNKDPYANQFSSFRSLGIPPRDINAFATSFSNSQACVEDASKCTNGLTQEKASKNVDRTKELFSNMNSGDFSSILGQDLSEEQLETLTGTWFETNKIREQARDSFLADLNVGENFNDEDYNDQVSTLLETNVNNLFGESCDSIDSCSNVIDERCDMIDFDSKCVAASEMLDTAKDNIRVETNTFFTLANAILNPDDSAIRASRNWGWADKYSLLDNSETLNKLFGKSFPSQICLSKIDGLFDKELETGGGITRYGCTDDGDYEYDPVTGETNFVGDPRCLEVIYDLRGQRTQIAPDGTIQLSYSYYIQAPKHKNIKYTIVLKYMQDGEVKKQSLFSEIVEVLAEEISSGSNFVALTLEGVQEAEDASDFYIGLIALDETEEIYLKIAAPVVLISGGTYLDPLEGNTQGNDEENSGGSPPSSELDLDDLIDLS